MDLIKGQAFNPPRPEGLHVLTSYTIGENKLVEMYQHVHPESGAIDFIKPAAFIGHDVFQMRMRNPQNGEITPVDQPISFPIKAQTIVAAVSSFKAARQEAVHALLAEIRRQAIAAGARMADLGGLTPDA